MKMTWTEFSDTPEPPLLRSVHLPRTLEIAMCDCRFKIMLGTVVLFAATLPSFAGDSKAIESLKAAGIPVTTLPGGGSRVSVTSDKINDNLWTQLEALGDLKMFGVKDKAFDNA